jgi:hypothetical protein
MSASDVVQQAAKSLAPAKAGSGNQSLSVEVGKGAPPADQPIPRSDAAGASGTAPDTSAASAGSSPAPADQNELTPNPSSGDSNELKPNVPTDSQALPPPQQVNEIQAGSQQAGSATQPTGTTGQANDSASSSQQTQEDTGEASSKHKKKKGIHKIIPF